MGEGVAIYVPSLDDLDSRFLDLDNLGFNGKRIIVTEGSDMIPYLKLVRGAFWFHLPTYNLEHLGNLLNWYGVNAGKLRTD